LSEIISKLSNVFHRERGAFEETKEIRKWSDTVVLLSISDFFTKKGNVCISLKTNHIRLHQRFKEKYSDN